VFAGLFTDETLPTEIVVRGADGSELARTPVVNPGTGGGGSFSGRGTEITTPSG